MILCGLIGVLLIIVGLILLSGQYLMTYSLLSIRKKLPLVEGSVTYDAWTSPIQLTFACYVFNVTNPDEVMQGHDPNLVDVGPFTYTEIFEKQVLDIDEEADEIFYTTKSTYAFDKHKSTNISTREKVTILNPAYIGTISTLTAFPPQFMQKYGNNIPKLFPNRTSIFLKAHPTDIIFNGVKITCNVKKYPELNLVCKTLQANPPPVLRSTDKEGVYLLSIFQRVNSTFRGPFSINRGVKNISLLGDLTSYMGERVQTHWKAESCNKVRGTDTITWPPLVKPLPYVSTFIHDLCRSIEADYEGDISIKGMTGAKYIMKERTWFPNNTECYCPVVQNKMECLPWGLTDLSSCMKMPTIYSEPHFLHADPALLTYARGLKPDEKLHSTYIVIEPVTGAPLSGQKKMQINLKLTKQPVDLLSNVSEGYFPLMWCENGNTPTLSIIAPTYQILRLIHLISFMQNLPLIVGIYMVLVSLFLHKGSKYKLEPSRFMTEPTLVMSNLTVNDVLRETPRQPLHAFERFQRVYTTL